MSTSYHVANNMRVELIMKTNNNIILIGYMGCGKTTLGKKTAQAMKYRFVDTDDLVEEKEGCSISELFRDKGEPYFRKCETAVLQSLCAQKSGMIIASGGGLPLIEENAELLHRLGTVIYLKAEEATLVHRLKNDTKRPLLATENLQEKVHQMLLLREPVYEKVADHIIQVDALSIYELINKIEQWNPKK